MSYTDHIPGIRYTELADLAADQYGFVTQADAASIGVPADTLVKLAARGQLTRVATGVYRVPLIPPTPLDPYMQATLWPRKARGVISHETALDLYGISDVNPEKIHLTVPREHRPRREVPKLYVLHREDLVSADVTTYEGIPIVTPAKAIAQAHEAHLGPALIRQAIADGRDRGLLTRSQAETLERELGVPVGGSSR